MAANSYARLSGFDYMQITGALTKCISTVIIVYYIREDTGKSFE